MFYRPCPNFLFCVIAFLGLTATGCGQRYLVATPNLLKSQESCRFYKDCPPSCQEPDMEIPYLTDRETQITNKGQTYGYGRAKRIAFGQATVLLDPRPSWEELIQASTSRQRRRNYILQSTACRELGSFEPARKENNDETILPTPEAVIIDEEKQNAFHQMMQNRLAATSQKDVFLFIHGFNNTFEDAILQAAEVWHFLGRIGVPLVYSWPAGYGGLRGYAYDRESGEFTVYHLKQCIRSVASCPGVERIHLVAHSRGTDVTISALRELHIACRAQGRSTQEVLKLENLVLAAPDVDDDVFLQRFIAEEMLQAAHRTTIYVSPRDKALELAELVFASGGRLGTLRNRDFSPKSRQALASFPNLNFVECRVTHFSTSHNYVFAHPAALSDLILVLRDRRDPGPQNGRPLTPTAEGIWELNDHYLAQGK